MFLWYLHTQIALFIIKFPRRVCAAFYIPQYHSASLKSSVTYDNTNLAFKCDKCRHHIHFSNNIYKVTFRRPPTLCPWHHCPGLSWISSKAESEVLTLRAPGLFWLIFILKKEKGKEKKGAPIWTFMVTRKRSR